MAAELITEYIVSTRRKGYPDVRVVRAGPGWCREVLTGRVLQTVHLTTGDLDAALARAREIARRPRT